MTWFFCSELLVAVLYDWGWCNGYDAPGTRLGAPGGGEIGFPNMSSCISMFLEL